MKLATWTCILCIETALALYFAIGAVQSYGLAASLTCQPSRSNLTPPLCVTHSLKPMPLTTLPKPCSTAQTGYATWYSTNSIVADYKVRGQAIPTNGVFPMANGEPLDDNAMTCALWKTNKHNRPLMPDGRLVKVIDAQTGYSVKVAWTDNGPGSVPRSRGVVVDLTPAAMLALAGPDGINAGRVKVKIERI